MYSDPSDDHDAAPGEAPSERDRPSLAVREGADGWLVIYDPAVPTAWLQSDLSVSLTEAT